jgi:hypothetical protein
VTFPKIIQRIRKKAFLGKNIFSSGAWKVLFVVGVNFFCVKKHVFGNNGLKNSF